VTTLKRCCHTTWVSAPWLTTRSEQTTLQPHEDLRYAGKAANRVLLAPETLLAANLRSKILTVRRNDDRFPPRNWFNDQTSVLFGALKPLRFKSVLLVKVQGLVVR
jgi:hypothetical protein